MNNKSFLNLCLWSIVFTFLIIMSGILFNLYSRSINANASIFLGLFLIGFLVFSIVGGLLSVILLVVRKNKIIPRIVNFFGVSNAIVSLIALLSVTLANGLSKYIYWHIGVSLLLSITILYKQYRQYISAQEQ
ncbi:MAG: hypothetical protein PHD73_00670 [Sediminibacterium sp.]|nr:hypothetical protein [Sediminibacterium sp.]